MTRELCEKVLAEAGCLIPREEAEVPSCHEHTFCDCTTRQLAKMLLKAIERVPPCTTKSRCMFQDDWCESCKLNAELDRIAAGEQV